MRRLAGVVGLGPPSPRPGVPPRIHIIDGGEKEMRRPSYDGGVCGTLQLYLICNRWSGCDGKRGMASRRPRRRCGTVVADGPTVNDQCRLPIVAVDFAA